MNGAQATCRRRRDGRPVMKIAGGERRGRRWWGSSLRRCACGLRLVMVLFQRGSAEAGLQSWTSSPRPEEEAAYHTPSRLHVARFPATQATSHTVSLTSNTVDCIEHGWAEPDRGRVARPGELMVGKGGMDAAGGRMDAAGGGDLEVGGMDVTEVGGGYAPELPEKEELVGVYLVGI